MDGINHESEKEGSPLSKKKWKNNLSKAHAHF